MLAPGKTHCLGGEVELLGRIKYNDGLDKYRLTVDELKAPTYPLPCYLPLTLLLTPYLATYHLPCYLPLTLLLATY